MSPLTAASFLLQATPWVSLDVRRGSVADISAPIPAAVEQGDDPQECLVWQFVLQEYDVGFQLLENGAVVQDLGRFRAKEDGGEDPNAMAMDPPQFEALGPTMEGRFDNVKSETVYTLRWDNAYSLVRHKQLRYRFLVTSRRAVAAAELAVQESQSRSQIRARRAAAGLPLPHLAKTLAKERAMTDEGRKVENERVTAHLEQAVMDIVSIFTAKPDSPLHEGAVRPFVLALEAVLCNGIKEEFLEVWPEAPFCNFLLETQQVLRDDMGIVAEVQASEAPPNLQFLGWNHARSFLLLALNKGILHRAFENLSKRRVLVERYYEPRALLYKYEDARKIASFLSALNGVKFLLAAYPPDECDAEERKKFPRNLKQCAPEAPLLCNEIAFRDGVEGDSSVVEYMEEDPDKIKELENCTVTRYILHGRPFQDIVVGRSSIEKLSVPNSSNESFTIVLAQMRVQTQDIIVSFASGSDSEGLTEPHRLSAADGWVELMLRIRTDRAQRLVMKLDNSYSMCSRHHVQVNGKEPQLKVCDGCFIKEKNKERKRIAGLKKDGGESGERPEFTALRNDPSMDKYFKMLNFGVPSSGVAQKMAQDEMPPEKIAIFAAGPDGSHALASNEAARKRERSGSRGLNRRDSTFRKVYWTSLETKKANETIWARVTSRRKTAPITLSPHDFQELEILFGNRTAASPSEPKAKTAKKTTFSALDSRRSNNISIGLSQFKAVGGAEAILAALKSCDFEFLTVDRLTNLQSIAPNSVEVKRYSNFRGSRSRLELSEKFLVEMCEISRVTEKINVMLFAFQFEHQQRELRTRIKVITQACYEVLRCERLARCFELVLAIGNLLNTGSELEGAQGITLASLLKLSETKAIDQSMTLLQFIIKLIHDRGEGDVLLFINELSSLAEAKRFSNTFEPRHYKMESKFISVMRERLMNIKAVFEDVEMELESLHSVWDGTARYLAEDPSGSSSEYVFGLLNRFLLDFKVAKTLLFRKGLSFANEANTLLPHAFVGSIVATKFGSGVITALRVTDKRIEYAVAFGASASFVKHAMMRAFAMFAFLSATVKFALRN
ncbi:Formin protein 6 [Phytophthora cinnamomi]|uniref:Formin protein 6 n=1 Tax=Phytophthora cinnamomi TaxID=4785 RepID=UPI00355A8613|nr:Formin protein 6 [Phytophthora cinnamomi]